MKHLRRSIVALSLTLLVLVTILFVPKIVSKIRPPENTQYLLNFNPENVRHIALTDTTRTINLTLNSHGQWQVVSPIKDRANDPLIRQILSTLDAAKIVRSLPADGLKMAEWGLTAPEIQIELSLYDGRAIKVMFGKFNPLGTLVYARTDSNPEVCLVYGDVFRMVSKRLFELRDRRLLPVRAEDIVEISHNLGSVPMTWRRLDKSWELSEPYPAPARVETIQAWIDDFVTAQVMIFVDENPTDLSIYGLNPPVYEIRVRTQNNKKPDHLWIGDKTPDGGYRYARRSTHERILKIPAPVIDKDLAVALIHVENRYLTNFQPSEIETIEIISGNNTIVLSKKSYLDWVITKPINFRAANEAIDSLLTYLTGAKYDRLVSKSFQENADPLLSIKCVIRDPKIPAWQMDFYDAGAKIHARTSPTTFTYELPRAVVNYIPQSANYWRDRYVLRFKPYEVQKINGTVDRINFQLSKKAMSGWLMKLPEQKDLSRHEMNTLMEQLNRLRIKEFNLPTAKKLYPDEAWLFLELTLPERIIIMHVLKSPDGYLAQTDDFNGIVQPDDISRLSHTLHTLLEKSAP